MECSENILNGLSERYYIISSYKLLAFKKHICILQGSNYLYLICRIKKNYKPGFLLLKTITLYGHSIILERKLNKTTIYIKVIKMLRSLEISRPLGRFDYSIELKANR